METANQLYKSSQSPLPFKEWLKREQIKGKLETHQKQYINANGDDDVQVTSDIQPNDDKSKHKFLFGLALGIGATLLIQKLLKK